MLSVSRILAVIAGLIGLLVLAGGWILDISPLRSIISGASSMKVNTALGLILTAGAILVREIRFRPARRLMQLFAALLILISVITLIEYASGRNFGIDQLLIADHAASVSGMAPGRMSVVTAISFLLLGFSLLLRDRTVRRECGQLLAIGAGTLCLANLIGYLYGIHNFAGIAFYTDMAVHTSSSLLILSLSMLFSEPRQGLMALVISDNLGGVLTRRLLPAAVAVPLLLGWLRWEGELKGLYGTAFGVALFATANIVVLTYLVWATGQRLDRLDSEKARNSALLLERENLLSIFIRHVPAAVAMLDRDLRYLQVSDRWLTDVGIRDGEILGRSHDATFPGLSDQWTDVYRRALAGESLKAEGDWAAPDGNTHNVRWEVHPWGDSGINTGGVVVFFEDITERKRAELELRKFVSLADNSSEFVGMCDMNLMPFYANQASWRLVGLESREQALQTPVPSFFFPEDRRFILEEFFPRVMREGRAEVEIRFRHFQTGQPLWMIYNVFYIKNEAGQPVGLATVSRDITERRLAEDAQREKEATIRTLLENAAQAILAVDVRGTIVLANRMAGEMFGYTRDDLLGQPLEILLPEHLRSRHAADRARFFANPKTRAMGVGPELMGLRSDGLEFPIEVSLSSLETSTGPLAVSFVSDITTRRQAESALRNSEQQLRDLAGSLINALEDERRRLSRELHDDVTQQLAFLSIELGKLRQQTSFPVDDTQARIRALQSQTLRTSNELRRISHGLHPSVIEDFGLSVALEEFCQEFGKAQNIPVIFDGLIEDSQLDPAAATCLYRIAQESLRNAVTHGRATEVRVELAFVPGAIQLRVRDNGVGLSSPQTRAKAGLGVISMRERIRLVGGDLTLLSQPGRGAEVKATVPLPERAGTQEEHEQNAYIAG